MAHQWPRQPRKQFGQSLESIKPVGVCCLLPQPAGSYVIRVEEKHCLAEIARDSSVQHLRCSFESLNFLAGVSIQESRVELQKGRTHSSNSWLNSISQPVAFSVLRFFIGLLIITDILLFDYFCLFNLLLHLKCAYEAQ